MGNGGLPLTSQISADLLSVATSPVPLRVMMRSEETNLRLSYEQITCCGLELGVLSRWTPNQQELLS